MALTRAQRTSLARTPGQFPDQITGLIGNHAYYLLANPDGKDEAHVELARHVANNPDAYTWRFAHAVVHRPSLDAINGAGDVTDELAEAQIVTVWPWFAETGA